MQKFKYEKPLIELYLRPTDEVDVLDFIGTSPNAGGGSGNSGGAGSGGDYNGG